MDILAKLKPKRSTLFLICMNLITLCITLYVDIKLWDAPGFCLPIAINICLMGATFTNLLSLVIYPFVEKIAVRGLK